MCKYVYDTYTYTYTRMYVYMGLALFVTLSPFRENPFEINSLER